MQNKQLTYLLRFIVIGLILLLNACSTMTKDGPPDYNVDDSKISNATPKPEKLSKYGNYPTYRVMGHSYHVMSSSKDYEQVGVASWYGSKFHSKHTSNGERYNMLAMTAAHKTLPLPTYVLVTNISNGKKVIVRVNDRGPFESNRLIDLSYVAAKKLGMLGHGTALVDVKALDPLHYDKDILTKPSPEPRLTNHFDVADNGDINNTEEAQASESVQEHPHVRITTKSKRLAKLNKHHQLSRKSGVYLQVGAFRNKVLAERLQKRIHRFVHSPVIVSNSKHIYKVKIGPLRGIAAAKQISKQLKAAGLHSKEYTEV